MELKDVAEVIAGYTFRGAIHADSNGTTANKGAASVLYEIQITALQAAGNDYTNQLIYVATPTF